MTCGSARNASPPDLRKEMSGDAAWRELPLAFGGGMFGVAILLLPDTVRSALPAPVRVARLRSRIGTGPDPGKPSGKNPAFTEVRAATDQAGVVPVTMARIPG